MKKKLAITGMMCTNCQANVKKALEATDGVQSADVDWKAGTAIVTLENELEDRVLRNAVEGMESKRDFLVTAIENA